MTASIRTQNTTLASGDAIRWEIRLSGPTDAATQATIRAEVTALSPQPYATVTATAGAEFRGPDETREVSIPMDVEPGRYRLKLSVLGPDQHSLTDASGMVFVYPRQ